MGKPIFTSKDFQGEIVDIYRSHTVADQKVTEFIQIIQTLHFLPGVELSLVINGDSTNPITKYVDSKEGEEGENNLLNIHLRNQDYASVDYHDYLQLGLNLVQITLTPIGGIYSADCVYHLRALSIEKN